MTFGENFNSHRRLYVLLPERPNFELGNEVALVALLVNGLLCNMQNRDRVQLQWLMIVFQLVAKRLTPM